MSSPEVAAAFERFVELEEDLLALLRERLRGDREMLVELGGARTG